MKIKTYPCIESIHSLWSIDNHILPMLHNLFGVQIKSLMITICY